MSKLKINHYEKAIIVYPSYIRHILHCADLFSCSKSSTTSPSSTTPTQSSSVTNAQTSSDDQNYYKSENDQANTDISNDMNSYSSMQGRMAEGGAFQSSGICGIKSIDTTNLHSSPPTVVYNFDGTTNCSGRIRSGSITVQLTSGSKWSHAGAVLTFSTTNYSVKRVWDGKTITFSGTKTLENVNGSGLIQLAEFLSGTLALELKERTVGLKVTFNSGRQEHGILLILPHGTMTLLPKLLYIQQTGILLLTDILTPMHGV